MLKDLVPFLKIQELDMQMLQLLRLKREREKELQSMNNVREQFEKQILTRDVEILDQKKSIRINENDLAEIKDKFKRLESQQHAIKKVEEFNALNHEMAQAERERVAKEHQLSDLYDQLAANESTQKKFVSQLEEVITNNKALEAEILESIGQINAEGREIKAQRDLYAQKADPSIYKIYERLFQNKRDRVIVSIENRCCSGCHIMLTAQDENLVRKAERIVFCEHCSRIHYWQESPVLEEAEVAPRQRRRRSSVKS